MAQTKVGLVGVTGYTGMELMRLLQNHDHFELVRVTSRAEAGKKLRDIYPFMQGMDNGELSITEPDADDLAQACDLVFLAVPHRTAMEIAAVLLEKGLKVVDLSADFRLRSKDEYEHWYACEHTQEGLLDKAVYGLPELYSEAVSQAQLVANPGCYPTSAILGLYPALKEGFILKNGIVVDSKSGTTGAGRKANVGSLFCEVSDSFKAYGLTTHRHTPEIEQELSVIAKDDITVSFNTHLLPINRGILSTIYTTLSEEMTLDDVHAIYEEAYRTHPWVRVLPKGKLPETKHVRGTMFCDIGLALDKRTNRLIIVSTIDNLCRGASGQALANANLMCGIDINEGLKLAPLMP
ncbi:N-acetyl-gamma-glutamyl-phosphate reductase [Halodesulfovibrio marinisediminis]|uniref:N-acetyl-gamma-glutamyl-phosphate reductase n=1 Tax=Halodesulfovibrio marinisediminis DSM 17456 TaxID=1121457 RepID=A0A1N6GPC2_9BACT|nr:N-acetyl-gamma-glutamyl-phosphate reductase [Halodesulfovibrio marinisediminis]SIO09364.1 N-acetyl-gamma-glutamyl-phosphate reductase [Halodesulfovibrio marinisediminis DSM 17456]